MEQREEGRADRPREICAGVKVMSEAQEKILLKNAVNQMIYKHAISTIVPAKSINIPMDDGDSDEGEGEEHNY